MKNYELFSKEMRDQLLIECNQTEIKYDKTKTIHQLFEEQVERTPDTVAVVFEEFKKNRNIFRIVEEKTLSV